MYPQVSPPQLSIGRRPADHYPREEARALLAPAMTHSPSGRQFEITHGEHRATVVEVGGGIREYENGGRPVLDPYPEDAICDGAHGAPLIPWPNRLADGRYAFGGRHLQLPLT